MRRCLSAWLQLRRGMLSRYPIFGCYTYTLQKGDITYVRTIHNNKVYRHKCSVTEKTIVAPSPMAHWWVLRSNTVCMHNSPHFLYKINHKFSNVHGWVLLEGHHFLKNAAQIMYRTVAHRVTAGEQASTDRPQKSCPGAPHSCEWATHAPSRMKINHQWSSEQLRQLHRSERIHPSQYFQLITCHFS